MSKYFVIFILLFKIGFPQQNNIKNTKLESITFYNRFLKDTISIKYNPNLSKVINKQIEEEYGPIKRIIRTKIDSHDSEYCYIDYNPGLSADPMFCIRRIDSHGSEKLKCINGLRISIPGDGNLYISGHTNNMFKKRRIYHLESNTLK